jgi:hypothetical protein
MRVNATGWCPPLRHVSQGVHPIHLALSAIINLMHDHSINFNVVIQASARRRAANPTSPKPASIMA